MACPLNFTPNGCVLEVDCNGEIEVSFDLATITWSNPSSTTVSLRDGNKNNLTVILNDVAAYNTAADLIAFIAPLRASCQAAGGGGGGGGTVNVTSTPYSDGSLITACTPTGEKIFVQVIWDEDTESFTFKDTAGNILLEGTDFENCDGAGDGITGTFRSVCMCDQAGDGSVIAEYIDLYFDEYDGTTFNSTLVGTYVDDSYQTTYAVTGTGVKCSTVGTPAEQKQGFTTLENDVWSPSAMITSFTVRVRTTAGTATITDSDGNVTILDPGESVTWSRAFNIDLMDTAPVVFSGAGDSLRITYTYIG